MMSEDKQSFSPHMDVAVRVVDLGERLVFTNAVDRSLRPADPRPVSVTGEVTLVDHPEGIRYRIVARHGNSLARARHEQLGPEEGWSLVAGQLAELVET